MARALGLAGRGLRIGVSRPGAVVASPSPPASTPISATDSSAKYGWKMPSAFEPPPTHAITASGWRPAIAAIWRRASRPITDWKSRTMSG